MFKKIFFLIGLLISQYCYARVIELDNMNADHCRQQLLNSKDSFPIIFVYMRNCPFANKLRPLYEQVSDETPNRKFFAFNFQDHDDPTNYIRQAQSCLGKMPIASPSISIYMVDKDDAGRPLIIGELKSGLNGGSTKEDIINFINMDQRDVNSRTLSRY